jgi:hypothetical protein
VADAHDAHAPESIGEHRRQIFPLAIAAVTFCKAKSLSVKRGSCGINSAGERPKKHRSESPLTRFSGFFPVNFS